MDESDQSSSLLSQVAAQLVSTLRKRRSFDATAIILALGPCVAMRPAVVRSIRRCSLAFFCTAGFTAEEVSAWTQRFEHAFAAFGITRSWRLSTQAATMLRGDAPLVMGGGARALNDAGLPPRYFRDRAELLHVERVMCLADAAGEAVCSPT